MMSKIQEKISTEPLWKHKQSWNKPRSRLLHTIQSVFRQTFQKCWNIAQNCIWVWSKWPQSVFTLMLEAHKSDFKSFLTQVRRKNQHYTIKKMEWGLQHLQDKQCRRILQQQHSTTSRSARKGPGPRHPALQAASLLCQHLPTYTQTVVRNFAEQTVLTLCLTGEYRWASPAFINTILLKQATGERKWHKHSLPVVPYLSSPHRGGGFQGWWRFKGWVILFFFYLISISKAHSKTIRIIQ